MPVKDLAETHLPTTLVKMLLLALAVAIARRSTDHP